MTTVAILGYPLLAALLFRMMPFRHAVAATIVIGYVLLPPDRQVVLPALPDLNKTLMPALTALLLAPIFLSRQAGLLPGSSRLDREPPLVPLKGWLPNHPLVLTCVVVLFLTPVAVYLTNTEPVVDPGRFSQGLVPYDIVVMLNAIFGTFLGFFVARRYLHDEASHRAILLVLALAGLVIGLAALFEIRMSPRLNIMLYGYFPHEWRQHLRAGGFRPVVFFEHALVLAIFLCMAAIAVIAYFRTSNGERRALFFLAAVYLVAVIFLSRSFGIALIALVLVPLAFFLPSRMQIAFAATCVVIVTLYPAMKAVGFNPLASFTPVLETFRPDRVHSFTYRLQEGDEILAHVRDQPIFGWGIYSRWEASDPRGGTAIVPDAMWLVILARYGWVGYFAYYGAMFLPVVLLWAASREKPPSAALAGLTMVLAANALDLLPNSAVTPLTMLVAGAIMGHVDRVRQGVTDPTTGAAPTTAPATAPLRGRHSRGGNGGRDPAIHATAEAPDSAPASARPEAGDRRYTRFATRPRHRRV